MRPSEFASLRGLMNLSPEQLGTALEMTAEAIEQIEQGDDPVSPTIALAVRYLFEHPERRPVLRYGDQWGRWRFNSASLSLELDGREVSVWSIETSATLTVPLTDMTSASAVLQQIADLRHREIESACLGDFVAALDALFGLQATFVTGQGFDSSEAVANSLLSRTVPSDPPKHHPDGRPMDIL